MTVEKSEFFKVKEYRREKAEISHNKKISFIVGGPCIK